jgi:hypothetical protein
MTPRYTANTNFRSHRPQNGLRRFLAEPGFTEAWLARFANRKRRNHDKRPRANPGDLVVMKVKLNRNERFSVYGIYTSIKYLRFYNTREEAIAQRVLRDLNPAGEHYTYVFNVDVPAMRPSVSQQAQGKRKSLLAED